MNAPNPRSPLTATDDATLARAACTNQQAFAELYRHHALRVYRYVLAQTGHVQDAEDVTAQTFMHAHTFQLSGELLTEVSYTETLKFTRIVTDFPNSTAEAVAQPGRGHCEESYEQELGRTDLYYCAAGPTGRMSGYPFCFLSTSPLMVGLMQRCCACVTHPTCPMCCA
jgi:hypothetical protein